METWAIPAISCPKCSKKLKAPYEALGKKVKCKCGHAFVAGPPAPAESAEPTATKEVGLSATMPQFQLDSATDEQALEWPEEQADASEGQFQGLLNLFIIMIGFLALVGGIVGVLVALSMDVTVETSHIDDNRIRQTERVYNQGLMHARQVNLLTSCAAAIVGVLIIGLNSLHSSVLHMTDAIEELSLTADRKS